MATQTQPYPARLDVDYPESLDRVTTAFRIIWIIPIAIVLSALSATSTSTVTVISEAGQVVSKISHTGGGIVAGLFAATLLMLVFRQRYPRWWFDFALQFNRFAARVSAYGALLTDTYPSTVEEQAVHLDIDYPDVPRDLNRWMPLVKWLLVIPHLVVLAFLMIGALFAVIIAWFAILFTGHYPRGLFGYVVGVGRWALRVTAYATLLSRTATLPFASAERSGLPPLGLPTSEHQDDRRRCADQDQREQRGLGPECAAGQPRGCCRVGCAVRDGAAEVVARDCHCEELALGRSSHACLTSEAHQPNTSSCD